MQCHHCGSTYTHEHPVPLYRIGADILCERCVVTERVGVTSTSDILGTPPQRLGTPIFLESFIPFSTQSIYGLTTYLEGARQRLLQKAREQTIQQNGNVLLNLAFSTQRIDPQFLLLTLSGMIVWSDTWENHLHQHWIPQAIPSAELEADLPLVLPALPADLPAETEEGSVVGKYPDVGGDSQMARFRKLAQLDT